MFKWVAGLCAAMYLTLLIFGAPPEGEQTAALDLGTSATKVDVEVEPAVEAEAIAPTAEPEPVAANVAPAAPAELAPTPIISAVLEEDKALVSDANRETVTLTVAAPAPAPTTVDSSATAPVLAAQTSESTPTISNSGIGEIWTVTGSRVNLRAGATTQASVIGQTRRGDSAEVMELLDNGWARVYIIESGIEAYMSADFISRDG